MKLDLKFLISNNRLMKMLNSKTEWIKCPLCEGKGFIRGENMIHTLKCRLCRGAGKMRVR